MGPSAEHDDAADEQREMTCESARELISADADDALDAVDVPSLDAHLDGCAQCSSYQSRVAELSRSVRVRSAALDSAFVESVMQRAQPARLGRGGWLRPALVTCALVVMVQSLSPLVFGEIDDAPTHVARHVGASTFALGIGLLYVAWRPHRAYGMLPLVGALFAAMLVGAALDVAGGDRSAIAEGAHVVELVGMVLLWMVAGSPGWDRVEGAFRSRRRGGGVAPSTN